MFTVRIWLYKVNYKYYEMIKNYHSKISDSTPYDSIQYFKNAKKVIDLLDKMNEVLDREKKYLLDFINKYPNKC